MNTKLYKFTILSESFFAILLFVYYYINPFWDYNNKLKISKIFPNEFYLSLLIPFISLLFCFILSFTIKIIFNSKQVIHKEENELVTKNLRNFNFWRFTFFTNLCFSTCFLLYAEPHLQYNFLKKLR